MVDAPVGAVVARCAESTCAREVFSRLALRLGEGEAEERDLFERK